MNYQVLEIKKETIDDDWFDESGFYTNIYAIIKWRENDVEEKISISGENFSDVKKGVDAHILKTMSFHPEEVFSRVELPKELRFVPLCEDDFLVEKTGDVMSLTNEDAHDPELHGIIWSSMKKGIPKSILEILYIEMLSPKKTNVYVGTAFTFNMVEDLTNINVEANPISWEEMDACLFAMKKQHSEFVEVINGMGHESTSQMLGEHSYRRSLSLKKGDILYIPQYRGPRLPEGETKLPKGALLVPIRVEIK